MSEVSHQVMIHRRAKAELDEFHPDIAEDLKERIRGAARRRQPKTHPCVEPLESYDLVKVRGDGVRAICRLDKPEFQVLLVGNRRTVYNRLDVAARRAEAATEVADD